MLKLNTHQLRPKTDLRFLKLHAASSLDAFRISSLQSKAEHAITYFGTLDQPDFHCIAIGPSGIGRATIIKEILGNLHAPSDRQETSFFVASAKINYHFDCITSPQEHTTSICTSLNALYHHLPEAEKHFVSAVTDLAAQYPTIHTLQKYCAHLIELTDSERKKLYTHYSQLAYPVDPPSSAIIHYEKFPSVENLFGSISLHNSRKIPSEQTLHFHTGLLHHNSSFLMINGQSLIQNESFWQILKQTLDTGVIQQRYNEIGFAPYPITTKIILLLERSDYYQLQQNDPQLADTFKIIADFDESLVKNKQHTKNYGKLLHKITTQRALLPLSTSAVAEVIAQGSRQLEDAKKLYFNLRFINELLVESSFIARQAKQNTITEKHVRKSAAQKHQRLNRAQKQALEDIKRKFIFIDTHDKKIGTVNALTVAQIGDCAFGHPARITAIVRAARSCDIVNIEREIDLSGPIHSKGLLTLIGYLKNQYNYHRPLTLHASITFEQTYDPVDGDSASLAELCALLSAISEHPILQSIGITGSINQHGEVQAIGYVNEKIEGFYQVCLQSGINGHQGVIIPKANQQSLVLNCDIIEAVKKKKFHVYAVEHVDQALSILTQQKTATRDVHKKFKKNTINFDIDQRLNEFYLESKSNE